jgi:hypothetical protein
MDTAPSLRNIDISCASSFRRQLIARAVPEMMDLAREALEGFENIGVLPSEVTPAAVVAMVLDDMLPLLTPEVGLPWGMITLQCALLDQLTELTEWELDVHPPSEPSHPGLPRRLHQDEGGTPSLRWDACAPPYHPPSSAPARA